MKISDQAQSYLAEGCAWFLIILSLCLGIGGCSYLVNRGHAERDKVTNHDQ